MSCSAAELMIWIAPNMFALVGLTLTAVGLDGVLSYTFTQGMHEIGIRMALGVQTSDVLNLDIGQGMRLAFVGLLNGLAGALALTRLMTLLFGVSATDQITFGDNRDAAAFVRGAHLFLLRNLLIRPARRHSTGPSRLVLVQFQFEYFC